MSELEEVRKLLSEATYPGVVKVLKEHEAVLEASTAAAAAAASASEEKAHHETMDTPSTPSTVPAVSQLKQNVTIAAAPASTGRVTYTPITDFAWDQNGYDSPTVTVYVDLEGVGSVKDAVTVKFTKSSFDLEVIGLNGKSVEVLNW